MTRASPRLTAWLLCATLTTSQLASAQGPSSRADALFREGRDAFKRQDYPTACQKFTESYALDESPGTLLNLGSCEEKTGRVGLAWRHLTDAIAQLPSTDDRLPVARKLLDGLNAKVARLTLSLTNAESTTTKVRLDGIDVPARQRKSAWAVDPGEHVVLGTTDDGREARKVIQAAAGQSLDVALLFPAPETATPARTSPGETNTEARSPRPPPAGGENTGSTQRTLGYVAGALGLVGLGVGTGFAFRVRSLNQKVQSLCPVPSSCQEPQLGEAQQDQRNSTGASHFEIGGFIAGGALVALGAVLVLTAPSPSRSTPVSLQLSPTIHPRLVTISLQGNWK